MWVLCTLFTRAYGYHETCSLKQYQYKFSTYSVTYTDDKNYFYIYVNRVVSLTLQDRSTNKRKTK